MKRRWRADGEQMELKSKRNYKKPYLSNKKFMDQIEQEEKLKFESMDRPVSGDRCVSCNKIVDKQKANKIIVDFTGGRFKNFPSGTITDYFCPVCEAILCGHTEIKEN